MNIVKTETRQTFEGRPYCLPTLVTLAKDKEKEIYIQWSDGSKLPGNLLQAEAFVKILTNLLQYAATPK